LKLRTRVIFKSHFTMKKKMPTVVEEIDL